MFGFLKSKPKSSDNGNINSEDIKPARRTTSEPMLVTPDLNDNAGKKRRGSSTRSSPEPRDRSSKNDFDESRGGLENQTMEQLETYAVKKAEETTSSVNNCLRMAENIREDATKTLDMLHQQGEQINKTHNMTVDTDKDLTKGEKLLSGLGGIFSRPKMPKYVNHVKGPVSSPDNPSSQKQASQEERKKLGLGSANKGQKGSKTPPPEPTNAIQKVELEKQKQDDALSDLSNILGDLKGMAEGMGIELNRQNKDLDHLSDDVDILNDRMKNTNQRAKKLLK